MFRRRRPRAGTHRCTRVVVATALTAVIAVGVVACGGTGIDAVESSGSTSTDTRQPTGPADDLSSIRMAALFSGPVADDDYNELGYQALQAAQKAGVTTSYTESVPVPNAVQVIRDYVDSGNTVIWTHGSQFYAATAAVARDNPNVGFIAEFDGHPDNQPPNVWVLDRQFQLGFYAVGVLASKLTKSGKIGYVGGLPLPFSYAEIHAMRQAIEDTHASVTVNPVWTGDFNDQAKAQLISKELLKGGADVLVGSLNDGAGGIFKAADAGPGKAWVTAKNTDKSSLDTGGHYAGTVLYNFANPLVDVLSNIAAGIGTGYFPLGFDSGFSITMPDTVPADVQQTVRDAVSKVKAGSITVKLDTTKVD